MTTSIIRPASRPSPSAIEQAVHPPKPIRVLNAEMAEKTGPASEMAASWKRSPQLAWDLILERVEKAVINPEDFGAHAEEDLEYHSVFFLHGLTAVVRMWLQKGCPETSAELYDLIRRQGAVQEVMTGW